ncbi:MAG: hypothetical protein ACLGI9_18200 [Thermoanaerobaculia bacterium]
MSRTAVVAVVAFTLVLASVPAAQASPFGSPSLDTRAGWFDVALSWLSGLLFGEETSSSEPRSSAFEAAQTLDPSLGDFATPMSGGCMDPEGRPRPTCY